MIDSMLSLVAARGAEVPVADPRLAAYVGDIAVDTVETGSAAPTVNSPVAGASAAQPTSNASSGTSA